MISYNTRTENKIFNEQGGSMVRRLTYLFIILIVVLSGCAFGPEVNEEFLDYPFSGVVYSEMPDPDPDLFIGSYARKEGNYDLSWEIFNFQVDGTLIIVPYTSLVAPFYDPSKVMSGTWTMDGEVITLTFNGKTLSGTMKDVISNSKKTGFEFEDQENTNNIFVKVSDDDVDISIYDNDYISGLYFREDSYGSIYGYRYLPNKTYYHYDETVSDGKGSMYTYEINPEYAQLKTGIMTVENYVKLGDYFIIGGLEYMEVK